MTRYPELNFALVLVNLYARTTSDGLNLKSQRLPQPLTIHLFSYIISASDGEDV